MMPYRKTTFLCIIGFTFGVILFSFTYGPYRRTYLTPPKVITVSNESEIYDVWNAAGIKGRIAIIFSPNFDAQMSQIDTSMYADQALKHGIVRSINQVVPPKDWAKVYNNNFGRVLKSIPVISDTYYSFLHEAGRINVIPMSALDMIKEKSLIIVEPDAWNVEEQAHIRQLIRSGKITSDLIVMLGGTERDAGQFRSILMPSERTY